MTKRRIRVKVAKMENHFTPNVNYAEMEQAKMDLGIYAVETENEEEKEIAKMNAGILKAMVIIIVVYFVLTFPVACLRIAKLVSGPDGFARLLPGWVTLLISFFQFCSSIVNPLIYGLLRKDFKDAYGRIWKHLTCR